MSDIKNEASRGSQSLAQILEKRQEERYQLAIEIEVTGIDRNGQVFHERTFTRDVSTLGCAFPLPFQLQVDDIISLRVMYSDTDESALARQSLFQVMRSIPERGVWLVGALKMEGAISWGADIERILKDVKMALKVGNVGEVDAGERRKEK